MEALENYFSGNQTNNQTNNTNNNPEKITFTWITGLALVDAVNPCALAVLTLLLTTILLKDPTKKRNALLSGIAFSLSILICYFVLGTLIILGFKKAAAVSSLSRPIFYQLLGGFAIIIGLLNLKDFFKFGAGGFVMEVPMSWRPKMKKIIRSAISPKGAFFVGIVVSLFLLPCTAGPYFVAGGILADVLWSTAIQWLFYYNLIFIIPMVAITIFVYLGLSKVEDVSGWRTKNIRYLHLFAGLILLVLGILMVLGIV
jgi:thiol:disulfide interchange protein